MTRGWALAACALAACADSAPPPDTAARPSHAGLRALPVDPAAQARAALCDDALRRAQRFREAVSPGSAFAESAPPQSEIDAGLWSSGALYAAGARLFALTWTRALGFGGRDAPTIRRVHRGRRGGPDATRCATCHWRGGPAGAGDAADDAYLDGDGDAPASGLARNPRPLHGAGLLEAVARALSADLQRQRDEAARAARAQGRDVRVSLRAQGISFGDLTARPDGALDLGAVRGVDGDLVVRPFGWKGSFASLRDVVEDELLTHHGIESSRLAATATADRVGPWGGADPDGDGVRDEAREGQVTALTLFVAMQETPQVEAPPADRDRWLYDDGERRFGALGCAACHTPSLRLARAEYVLPSRDGGAALRVDLARDGAEPRIEGPSPDGGYRVWAYSDLRRHDMGDGLAEAHADRGAPAREFVTPPLWGLARSRPYLHDGRAPTVEDAILLHGGEAAAARDAYAALDEPARSAVRVFLAGFTRARRMIAP